MSKLKQIASIILSKPIPDGYGTTTDNTKFSQDPSLALHHGLVFFKMKDTLGAFEIQKTFKEKDVIKMEIYHVNSNKRFTVTRELFDLLFEELVYEPPQALIRR